MRTPASRRHALFAAAALAAAGGALVIGLLAAPRASADDDEESFPPVADAVVQQECSACHMAYPAGLLPGRSWRAVMAGLDDHFGENASLDAASARHISDYLVAHAADAGGRRPGVLRGLAAAASPLRISETPWWIREHRGEVAPGAYDDPRIGSPANCPACHRAAARGIFEDD